MCGGVIFEQDCDIRFTSIIVVLDLSLVIFVT